MINCSYFFYNSARFTFSRKLDAVNCSQSLFDNANLEVSVCCLTVFKPLHACFCPQVLMLALHVTLSLLSGSLPTSCGSASPAHSVGNLLSSAAAQPTTALPQLLAAPQPAAMPQFILASGQLVQGIQGAQLLIPTSQGAVYVTHRVMDEKLQQFGYWLFYNMKKYSL
jgi:hypothetical protein